MFLAYVCAPFSLHVQVRRDVLLARAWREGDFATAGELCAGKSERHIVAEQLQAVRTHDCRQDSLNATDSSYPS